MPFHVQTKSLHFPCFGCACMEVWARVCFFFCIGLCCFKKECEFPMIDHYSFIPGFYNTSYRLTKYHLNLKSNPTFVVAKQLLSCVKEEQNQRNMIKFDKTKHVLAVWTTLKVYSFNFQAKLNKNENVHRQRNEEIPQTNTRGSSKGNWFLSSRFLKVGVS